MHKREDIKMVLQMFTMKLLIWINGRMILKRNLHKKLKLEQTQGILNIYYYLELHDKLRSLRRGKNFDELQRKISEYVLKTIGNMTTMMLRI